MCWGWRENQRAESPESGRSCGQSIGGHVFELRQNLCIVQLCCVASLSEHCYSTFTAFARPGQRLDYYWPSHLRVSLLQPVHVPMQSTKVMAPTSALGLGCAGLPAKPLANTSAQCSVSLRCVRSLPVTHAPAFVHPFAPQRPWRGVWFSGRSPGSGIGQAVLRLKRSL